MNLTVVDYGLFDQIINNQPLINSAKKKKYVFY